MDPIRFFTFENNDYYVICSYGGKYYLWTMDQVKNAIEDLENMTKDVC